MKIKTKSKSKSGNRWAENGVRFLGLSYGENGLSLEGRGVRALGTGFMALFGSVVLTFRLFFLFLIFFLCLYLF